MCLLVREFVAHVLFWHMYVQCVTVRRHVFALSLCMFLSGCNVCLCANAVSDTCAAQQQFHTSGNSCKFFFPRNCLKLVI